MVGASPEDSPQEYGAIVVIGGGCYGSYYVRQLQRAAAAQALTWRELLVVDQNADCQVARELTASPVHGDSAPRIVVQEWGAFLDGWIPSGDAETRDAIVPSPLMPHLFFEYIARRAQARWPGRTVERAPVHATVGTPWERGAPDHTTYVSHATWTCPVNCIEPRICPHTKGLRDWTMPDTLQVWGDARRGAGEALLGPFTFHCTHRAYGVGMVDRDPIRRAERAILEAGEGGPVRAAVATASHCHGAVAVMAIGPYDAVRE